MRLMESRRLLSRRALLAGLGAGIARLRSPFAWVERGRAAPDAPAPAPIAFPRDDAPHQALTEWWYYTGHLETGNGRRYGFEQVAFKARRGTLAGFAAHAAVTDSDRQRFRYDQRAVLDDGSIARPRTGFDLAIGNWSMRGANGSDELAMSLPGYACQLRLTSRKPPVLHGGDGYVRGGSGAESYYYSRTRMAVAGTLTVDGVASAVTGEAWMDHQWGDFTSFSAGGWDWFSVQLDDATEVMIDRFRDAEDVPSLGVATYVRASGSAVNLAPGDVTVGVDGTWVSLHSRARYPSAWTVALPNEDLTLKLVPTMADQELDTRETTGVTYWEGQVDVTGRRAGRSIAGKGYVELTGYTRARDGVVP